MCDVQEREFTMEDGTVVKRKLTDTELALDRLQRKRAREAEADQPSTGEDLAPKPKRRRKAHPARSSRSFA